MKNSKKSRYEEIAAHVLGLADPGDYGLCAPPMDAQSALYELCEYFLGPDWAAPYSCNVRQAYTEIVYAIECQYKGYKDKNRRKIRRGKVGKQSQEGNRNSTTR